MLRLKKSLLIFTLVMIGTLVFFGCDRQGSLNQNENPNVKITTYAGEAVQDSLDLETPSVFQQTIRWASNDVDGVVEGYAYRVVNEVNGVDEYLSTPGHDYIQDPEGWVYHYTEGANESIPMDSDQANITIWTKDVYAVVNFPANVDGDSSNVVSRFDVKCRDNSGEESTIDSKYFNVYSYQPGVSILSTSGDIAGEKVGTGIILEFSILDHNPYADVTPDHFEFKLLTKDNQTGSLTPQHAEEWISTKSVNNNTGNISQYALTNTGDTYPNIMPNNILGTVALDSTYIVARTVDVAGIISRPDTISVLVSEEFFPGTVIFDGVNNNGSIDSSLNDIWVLGEYHYVTYLSETIGSVIPNVNTVDGVHFSTPFWIDSDHRYTALNSNDLNIYVHWTWKGNYTNDNPNEKLKGEVIDETTGNNYYSDIVAFDLRLDGEAFVYPPLPGNTFNIIDEDGKEWLRVYKAWGLDIFENAVIYSLDSGDHRFEVRSVDLQLKADPTPSTLEFTLVEPIDPDQKQGILILDDDANDSNYSPDALVDDLYYKEYLFDYLTANDIDPEDDPADNDLVHIVDHVAQHNDNSTLHAGSTKFSPTDMQQYKMILFHSDRATLLPHITGEYAALNLYLKTGGNIVFSGCNNITNLQEELYQYGYPIMNDYFGVADLNPESNDVVNYLNNSFAPGLDIQRMHILEYASPDNGFTTTLNLADTEDNFNLFQTMFGNGGLGTISYFNEELLVPGTQVIYRLGSRLPGDGALDISHAEYDFYNGQPVALKKVTGESTCYTFGVPFSYLNKTDVKDMLNQIIIELGL